MAGRDVSWRVSSVSFVMRNCLISIDSVYFDIVSDKEC